MTSIKRSLMAAAGNAGESLYVEDVFSTYLYTGTGATQAITNGIDLDGEGGAIWFKSRSTATNHRMFDTDRGRSVALTPDTTAANGGVSPAGDDLASFNSDGFTVGAPWHYDLNTASRTYASWTFRKAEKFFDVVTFTGDGNSSHLISHNLGSTPAFMIMKKTDSTSGWMTAASDGAGNYKAAFNLNSTDKSWVTTPISTVSTDSTVDVGYWNPNWDGAANLSGATYVLYLFASDAGGFGEDGDESIIKCGSYVGNISSPPVINLGFEPQWILFKAATGPYTWTIFDVMRGWGAPSGTANDAKLHPNTTSAESADNWMNVTSTGFQPEGGDSSSNGNGVTYIYIAIRRPMKTPEAGTEVYAPFAYTGDGVSRRSLTTTLPYPDMLIAKRKAEVVNTLNSSRLTGANAVFTNTTAAESGYGQIWDYQGVVLPASYWLNSSAVDYSLHAFKRATGFFDVVCYTGTGVAKTEAHNLGVVPELMIAKRRNVARNWPVTYATAATQGFGMYLDDTGVEQNTTSGWTSTAPTASVFSLGTSADTNASGGTYVIYLFATLAGVSKVGSYTGTGADLNVDCGFSAGARFILIKRTNTTGDWFYWDYERGITAGNDPYLLLNSTVAQVTNTDYIDPLSSGFTVTAGASFDGLNNSGGSYIFLAIA